jgi:hypothetical protein
MENVPSTLVLVPLPWLPDTTLAKEIGFLVVLSNTLPLNCWSCACAETIHSARANPSKNFIESTVLTRKI